MAWQAGRPDVDRMLDEIEPAQFDEWVAWRQLSPDADRRLREIVKQGFAAVLSCMVETTVEPDSFDRWAEPNEAPLLSPQQAAAAVRQRYGR